MKDKYIMDSITRIFVDETSKSPAIEDLDINDVRKGFEARQQFFAKKVEAQIEDINIETKFGNVELTIVRPKVYEASQGKLPVIMYFHGGGWVIGSKISHDYFIRQLANGTNAAVVFVSYSLSPEAKHPVAIEQCYAATQWVAQNADSLNLDSTRLAIVGDSAGGCMAILTTLLAKERSGPKILYQVLLCPVTDVKLDSKSYQEFGDDAKLLNKKLIQFFLDSYYDKNFDVKSDYLIVPLNATIEQLKGLPDALVITAEYDVLRDEAEAYAANLVQAGVKVVANRYLGTIHDFMLHNPLIETASSKAAIAQINCLLKEALHKNEVS